jgi:hypothetical protein
MSAAKRQANSPAEKIPDSKKTVTSADQYVMAANKNKVTVPADPSKGSLVKFEVVTINGSPFYGSLAEVEIIHIWEKVLGRDRAEIYAMSYNRSLTRNFKVTIKLTTTQDAAAIYPEPNFEYHRKKPNAESDEDFDVLALRFLGWSAVKPAEIGQFTRISVKTNDFSVEPAEIIPWLSKFGSVNAISDYEKNSMGIRSDIFETEILLQRHIPEYLPIAGRKLTVYYPGIPKSCNNCYGTGHLKRNCKQKKKDWLKRVEELRASGDFEDAMFGGWISILENRI